MKNLILYYVLVLIFIITTEAIGQQPQWQWAVQAGGPAQELSTAIACDNMGNSYITGYFSMYADFDETTINSYGSEDIFIAKFNATGAVDWAKHAGSTTGSNYGEQARSIALDTQGNAYITGSFLSEAIFDQDTVTSNGTWDIFIAKYDSDGNCVWVKNAGGKNHDHGNAIALDNLGNVYVTGTFSYDAYFDGDSLHSDWGGQEVFFAKYSTNGDLIWVKKFAGPYSPFSSAICIDDSNNVYISGGYSNRITFDQTYSMEFSGGNNRIYVAKFNDQGIFEWARQAGGILNDFPNAIDTDSDGNVFVTGHFFLTAGFGSDTLTTMHADNNADIFLLKYDTNGLYQWVRQIEPTLGTAKSLVNDSQGNVTICGLFTDSLIVDNKYFYSDGDDNIFVARYDKDGNFQWLNQAGGVSGGDMATGIDLDQQGNMYVTGSIHSIVRFTPADTIDTGGGDKIFVAKIGDTPDFISEPYSLVNNYILKQNYPNPFNPATKITYRIPSGGFVKITIFDILGKRIDTIVNEHQSAGTYNIVFDGSTLSSGIYFYQMNLNNQITDIKKMILLR